MKILVVSDLYPPYYVGGYEMNCKDAVDTLINRGNEITVLTSCWGIKRKTIQGNIYRVFDFYDDIPEDRSWNTSYLTRRLMHLRRVSISQSNSLVTRKIISSIKPDIAFLWHMGNLTLGPAFAIQQAGIPMCYRIEDYSLARIKKLFDERESFLKTVYHALLYGKKNFNKLQFNNLLFISEYVKDYYARTGFPVKNWCVIPSGLPALSISDPSQRSHYPFECKDGIIRLIFGGRLEPEKGPDIAIRAIASLKSDDSIPKISLDIIGDGDPGFIKYLKELTCILGVKENVSFLGKLTQPEFIKLFQFYDALLLPSRWQEPFGRIVIEAMSQGLPVIATRSGGVPEIINNRQNGILVSTDDPQNFTEALRKLIQDPNLAAHISRNAYLAIRSHFTLEQVVDAMENYMLSMLKK